MKYLTIDTTTKITALSLADQGKIVSEGFLHTGKTHSERLIPMLDQMLHAADWKLEELGFIGVVRGPGSFTGIRIGIATAQGLAQVLKIPLRGITSLDTLAWAGYGREEETVVILDARKNEWYYARYKWLDKRQTLEGPKAVNPEQLICELDRRNRRYYFVGDAVPGAQQFIKAALGEKAIIPLEYQYLPRGAYAAWETWEQWQETGEVSIRDFSTVEPLYIRLSEAEVNFRKKHLEDS
ncbi:MAG: tRNA (adenosine(37)-N6)-threonylcarbamoyltransferase complex dimerization subunit type 1 TsaB [Peptococcaceae bacterium]|nr:tRNA (adenosine(37)-N6)-threonylcarbamoyltransferase complex dimerization subunit type 1 TsaB [Peptococcaceae bacterium]